MKWFSRASVVLLVLMLSMLGGQAFAQNYNVLPPTTQAGGWTVQKMGTAIANMQSGGQANGVSVTVSQIDGTNWHAMLTSPPVDVVDGQTYTISFVARASSPMHIDYDFTISDGDYHIAGMYATAALTTEWQKCRFTFKPTTTTGHHGRVAFILGNNTGTVWISSVKLVQGAPMALASETSEPNNWVLELHDPAKASMAKDGDALKIATYAPDGTDWHVQVFQSGIALAEGQTYIVSFDAKADRALTIPLSVENEVNYKPVGLSATIHLAPSWQRISYTFKAQNLQGQLSRLPLMELGAQGGTIWIKNATLVPTN